MVPEGLGVVVAPLTVDVARPLDEEGTEEPLGVVEAAGVLEPMGVVGAVIKLCSVALNVPVIPVKLIGISIRKLRNDGMHLTHVNLAEKPSYGN